MAARLQLTLAAVLGIVALVLGGMLLLGGSESGGADRLDLGPEGFAGALRSTEIPPAEFRLRDQDGRPTSLRDFRGKVTVVSFMYSTCQDSCPLLAQQIRSAMDDLGHDVPVLAISVDPAYDTQLNARRFVNKQSLTGRMRFLLGSRAELAPVWKAYAIQPQGKGFEHSAYVLLVDKRGRARVAFPIDHLSTAALTHDLRKLEAEPS